MSAVAPPLVVSVQPVADEKSPLVTVLVTDSRCRYVSSIMIRSSASRSTSNAVSSTDLANGMSSHTSFPNTLLMYLKPGRNSPLPTTCGRMFSCVSAAMRARC